MLLSLRAECTTENCKIGRQRDRNSAFFIVLLAHTVVVFASQCYCSPSLIPSRVCSVLGLRFSTLSFGVCCPYFYFRFFGGRRSAYRVNVLGGLFITRNEAGSAFLLQSPGNPSTPQTTGGQPHSAIRFCNSEEPTFQEPRGVPRL